MKVFILILFLSNIFYNFSLFVSHLILQPITYKRLTKEGILKWRKDITYIIKKFNISSRK